jgi:hypothetical protein
MQRTRRQAGGTHQQPFGLAEVTHLQPHDTKMTVNVGIPGMERKKFLVDGCGSRQVSLAMMSQRRVQFVNTQNDSFPKRIAPTLARRLHIGICALIL